MAALCSRRGREAAANGRAVFSRDFSACPYAGTPLAGSYAALLLHVLVGESWSAASAASACCLLFYLFQLRLLPALAAAASFLVDQFDEERCSSVPVCLLGQAILSSSGPSVGLAIPPALPALLSQSYYAQHAYYRLPTVQPGPPLNPFDAPRALAKFAAAQSLPCILLGIRQLLIKRELTGGDAETLMLLAYDLVAYASNWLAREFSGSSTGELVEYVARQFLVADHLVSICELLGPEMNTSQWWGPFMNEVLKPPRIRPMPKAENEYWAFFIDRVLAALDVYRAGRRAPPKEVVEIKRQIFCDPQTPRTFRRGIWNNWREDDEDSQGSQ